MADFYYKREWKKAPGVRAKNSRKLLSESVDRNVVGKVLGLDPSLTKKQVWWAFYQLQWNGLSEALAKNPDQLNLLNLVWRIMSANY